MIHFTFSALTSLTTYTIYSTGIAVAFVRPSVRPPVCLSVCSSHDKSARIESVVTEIVYMLWSRVLRYRDDCDFWPRRSKVKVTRLENGVERVAFCELLQPDIVVGVVAVVVIALSVQIKFALGWLLTKVWRSKTDKRTFCYIPHVLIREAQLMLTNSRDAMLDNRVNRVSLHLLQCNWRQAWAVLCFYSKTGFWPSYCQISTDLDKIVHIPIVWNILVGRLRPQSARGVL